MYNKKDKICLLYASNEHLITILTSYIYRQENYTKEIITIFEKNLENIADKILKGMDNKLDIKVDWKKTNVNELNEKLNEKLEGKIIIVCGEDKFVNNVNKILDNIKEDFSIINCFSILKGNKTIQEIINEYSKILTTEGIEQIRKVITCAI